MCVQRQFFGRIFVDNFYEGFYVIFFQWYIIYTPLPLHKHTHHICCSSEMKSVTLRYCRHHISMFYFVLVFYTIRGHNFLDWKINITYIFFHRHLYIAIAEPNNWNILSWKSWNMYCLSICPLVNRSIDRTNEISSTEHSHVTTVERELCV